MFSFFLSFHSNNRSVLFLFLSKNRSVLHVFFFPLKVCQLNDKIYYDVGKQDTASFTGEPGNIELTFTTGTPSAAR